MLLMAATFCQAEVTVYGIKFCGRTFEEVNEDMTQKLGNAVHKSETYQDYRIQLVDLLDCILRVYKTQSYGTAINVMCHVPVDSLENAFIRIKEKYDTKYGTPNVSEKQYSTLYDYNKDDCLIRIAKPLHISTYVTSEQINIYYTYQGKSIGIDEL